jgi:transcriptional regulator GlxA family with amidase domain
MSVNTFLRAFKKATGQTPHQYGLRVRLDHAAMLLLHSDHSIEQIAEACGFCDRHAFTRQFTRRRGSGPAAFRAHRS